VDPVVSKRKFDAEITAFRENEEGYRRRGWFLVGADYPEVLVVMAAPQLSPPALVMGVLFDYTDYDLHPPSVRLVNPFTSEPYKRQNLPTTLKRTVPGGVVDQLPGGLPLPPGVRIPDGAQVQVMTQQNLMQWYGDDDIPFLCIAGVREYHDHPAHSGDAWLLYRAEGAGRLVRLLEVIDKYGVAPITQYGIKLVPDVVGFQQEQPPE
jgi:hypothetical protein